MILPKERGPQPLTKNFIRSTHYRVSVDRASRTKILIQPARTPMKTAPIATRGSFSALLATLFTLSLAAVPALLFRVLPVSAQSQAPPAPPDRNELLKV